MGYYVETGKKEDCVCVRAGRKGKCFCGDGKDWCGECRQKIPDRECYDCNGTAICQDCKGAGELPEKEWIREPGDLTVSEQNQIWLNSFCDTMHDLAQKQAAKMRPPT